MIPADINKKTDKKVILLKEELQLLNMASKALDYSYHRCLEVGKKEQYTLEEEERFESLTSRFARLSDILIQKLFRLIDQIELEDSGSVRDRINRAEKKRLINSADDFILIRELRNSIAHEYHPEAIINIFSIVLDQTPLLFDSVTRINQHCKKYFI
jgi:hypothetical protein